MAEEKEKEAFYELKKRMEGHMESELYEDDNVFYRFLRARDFKIDKAEAMLREHLEWRKTYNVKNISEFKPPKILQKYFPIVMLGHDKEGHVLRYVPNGNLDLKGLVESCTLEDWKKYLIAGYEEDIVQSKKQSEKLGRLVDKIVYIHDQENLSLSTLLDRKVITYGLAIANMYQNNYPELLHTMYIINAPPYITLAMSILKSVLNNKIFEKMKVYSDDSWKAELLEKIDAEVLPAFLGGKRTDPDGNPLCKTIISGAEIIPKKYYLCNKKQSFSSLPEVQKVTISRGAVHEIRLEVKEPDSHVEWEFDVKSGDIKFGLLYQNEENMKTEVIPLKKISTDECTESGIYKCESNGKYIMVFDNTFSLVRSKDIFYKIRITPNEEAGFPTNHLL